MSNAKKDPNQQHYFSQIPKGEQDSLLERMANRHATIVLWRKGKDENDVEQFEIAHYHAEDKKLVLNPTKMIRKIFKSHLVDQDVLLKISEGNYNYFSNSHLKVSDSATPEYSVQLSASIFMSQQRKNYRLNASYDVAIQIKIGDIVYEGRDISAGGMSINIDPDKQNAFQLKTEFSDVTVRLNSYRWSLPKVRVNKCWPITSTEKSKKTADVVAVALEFINLAKGLEEDITKAVNSEARGEEVRKLYNFKSNDKS